jgi:hypothetical protein
MSDPRPPTTQLAKCSMARKAPSGSWGSESGARRGPQARPQILDGSAALEHRPRVAQGPVGSAALGPWSPCRMRAGTEILGLLIQIKSPPSEEQTMPVGPLQGGGRFCSFSALASDSLRALACVR